MELDSMGEGRVPSYAYYRTQTAWASVVPI